ncbi:hypothetical protein [Merismopedia glauca]|uniref:Uncharacterized protein n=1 Tax=Merismopedia glauca CCAP 1448/3 TaxID=1296344 RepID=A0A2T1BY65_9CYAN|nr:hypothetical protein [Merismopedia glauca]PSB00884.1 hypothetical protein C7B64_21220 [Merismopedia glauca CCAP 1448/3]
MKQLPNEKALMELVEMGKGLEEQTRKVYEMAEAFAQKWSSASIAGDANRPEKKELEQISTGKVE